MLNLLKLSYLIILNYLPMIWIHDLIAYTSFIVFYILLFYLIFFWFLGILYHFHSSFCMFFSKIFVYSCFWDFPYFIFTFSWIQYFNKFIKNLSYQHKMTTFFICRFFIIVLFRVIKEWAWSFHNDCFFFFDHRLYKWAVFPYMFSAYNTKLFA